MYLVLLHYGYPQKMFGHCVTSVLLEQGIWVTEKMKMFQFELRKKIGLK